MGSGAVHEVFLPVALSTGSTGLGHGFGYRVHGVFLTNTTDYRHKGGHKHMKSFTDMKNYDCVDALFAVESLIIPAIIIRTRKAETE